MKPPTFRYHNRDLPDGTYAVAFGDVDSWKRVRLETRWSSLGLVRRRSGGRWSPSCSRCLALNGAAPVGGRETAAKLLWRHWTEAHARRPQPPPQHTHGDQPIDRHEVFIHLLGPIDGHGHGRRSLSANESPTLAELHEGFESLRHQPDRQRPFADLRSSTLLAIHHDLHHPTGQQAIEDAAMSASETLGPGQPQTAGAT